MNSEKIIAFTFDDGPNTSTTMAMLDVLEKYDVRASFFLIGEKINEETIPVIKRELSLGCEVHNHTMTHRAMDQMDIDTLREEIDKESEIITAITGTRPRFFRLPFNIKNDLVYEVIDMPIICGIGVEDWVPEVSAQERTDRLLAEAVDGAIILLHDLEGNVNTVEALNNVIPVLRERGFKFVTITELFEAKNVPIRNTPGVIFSVLE